MYSEQENLVELTIFYPSSSGLSQSDSEHFECRVIQSEDDSEPTDDGFDRFTDH